MKLLKTQRPLSRYDFRASKGHNKVTFTVLEEMTAQHGPDYEGRLLVDIGLPGAPQKVYIPLEGNKVLYNDFFSLDEVQPGVKLTVEWLKDDENGEGEFEVFYDETTVPTNTPATTVDESTQETK